MLIEANGAQLAGWALMGKDKAVLVSDICSSQRQALELRKKQMIHQRHRGDLRVVPVVITVQVAESPAT